MKTTEVVTPRTHAHRLRKRSPTPIVSSKEKPRWKQDEMVIERMPHVVVRARRDQLALVRSQSVNLYRHGPSNDDQDREAHRGDDHAHDLQREVEPRVKREGRRVEDPDPEPQAVDDEERGKTDARRGRTPAT